MTQRPNILFLMADQHNAGSMGCAGHPTVRTPALDRLAANGVRFTRAYCNNPICAPSRVSFVTGQYCHTHRILGNDDYELQDTNPNTLGAVLRRQGYQTAQIGKAHMVGAWDREAYEHLRYCDLCDADRRDPRRHHYFKYLIDHGLADLYEDGTLPRDHEAHHAQKGCGVAALPYEHTIEHWTGEETLAFLRQRDRRRPFFVHMSFERPHPNWTPAREHAGLYSPDAIALGPDAADWWDKRWAGRPEFIRRMVAGRMARWSMADLQRILTSHFALVTVIDMEIGRVLDELSTVGDLDHTIVVYAADHGDFAGDHGICDKNIGIYESIHRIPFIVSYPGCRRGAWCDGIIESVDLLPTLCELAEVPAPAGLDGRSIVPELAGQGEGKAQAICEWDFPAPQRRVNAIRTRRYRLVYYGHDLGGELYDHESDPNEMQNRWDDHAYTAVRLELLERLFDQVRFYACKTDFDRDRTTDADNALTATRLIHKRTRKWSEFQRLLEA